MADSPYIIRFLQLPVGEHSFSFRIEDSFFQQHEGSMVHGAEMDVNVILYKTSNVAMNMDLHMRGFVAVECVRCLEAFRLPLEIEKSLVVRMVETPSAEEDDEDTIQVALSSNELDLSQTLYDFITLAIPYSPVHPDNADGTEGCNPQVVKHIQKNTVRDSRDSAGGDDRWDALKKIRLN